MQVGLILGGLVIALAIFTRRRVKDPDPLAGVHLADALASKPAQLARVVSALETIKQTKSIVLDSNQRARLERAVYKARHGLLYLGTDQGGFTRGYETREEYRKYIEQRYGPARVLTYNYELAVKLAPQVARHIRKFRGWYVIELVQDFQYAAGLVNSKGEASGRYGGRTMGALCFFMFEERNRPCDFREIPSPIHDPKWQVKYAPPQARQLQ